MILYNATGMSDLRELVEWIVGMNSEVVFTICATGW